MPAKTCCCSFLSAALTLVEYKPTAGLWQGEITAAQYRYSHVTHNLTWVGVFTTGALQHYSISQSLGCNPPMGCERLPRGHQ